MPNPLFQMLGGNQPVNDGGFGQMMRELAEFRRNFQGDPKQRVQELLNSGQMTQEQYNHLAQMATQIRRSMNGNF